MLGLNPDPAALARLRAELGVGQPWPARWAGWAGGLLAGDLGTSFQWREPVAGLALERLAVTLPLTLLAMALAVALALPAAIAAATAKGGARDALVSGLAQLGVATPNFWLAVLLVLAFAVGLGWLPAGGFPGWEAGAGPALRALLLPALALALPQAAILTRVARAALIEALAMDHVRTARAKGLTARAALRRHALPVAAGPVIAILGLQAGFLLAGAIIVETVFGLPGLGRLLFQAVAARDLVVVQSLVLLLVAAVVALSFLADLAAAALDPRLRGARA
jgi:peptide/nickel transport system permease protein